MYQWRDYAVLSILLFLVHQVLAQDAFPVSSSVSPKNHVKAGDTLNLTCSFELTKNDIQDIRFTEGTKQFYQYVIGGGSVPDGIRFGEILSEDAGVNSVVWITFPAKFCLEKTLERKYTCSPWSTMFKTAEAGSDVTYAGPSRNLTVNDKAVDGSLTLGNEVVNKTQLLQFVDSNEANDISDTQVTVNGENIAGSFVLKKNEKVCAFGAEMQRNYTFAKSGSYEVKLTITTSAGASTQTWTITVQEPRTTVATTTVTKETDNGEVTNDSPKNKQQPDSTTTGPKGAGKNLSNLTGPQASVILGLVWLALLGVGFV